MRRVAPAIGLFFLAPLVAEFLLGNIAIDALWALLVLAPLYGGGAVLIREVTRRSVRDWPTMVVLGLAYGLFEEGLVTQSLFNPGYAGANLLRATFVPALGIGVWWTVFVLTLHTVWSTSVPIAIVESFVPQRSAIPLLGLPGLIVTAALFVLGAGASFAVNYQQFNYLASAPRLIGTTATTAALIAVAFALPRAPRATVPTPAPSPWLVGIISFALASLFMLATMGFDRLGGWLVVGLYVLLDAIAIGLILRWSRQADWGAAHVLALAGGALLTYAWHAFPQTPVLGATGQLDLIGNAMFAIGAVALLAAAARVTGNGRHQLSVTPTHGTMPL
jgi:hypothetical protein